MKKFRRLIFPTLLLSMLAMPSVSRASLVWSWSFDQSEYVVLPTDTILVLATLTNSSSSTEDLQDVIGVGASFSGDLHKTYNSTGGPTGNTTDFSLQFFGIDLSPGESHPFVFAILTPIKPVNPGLYPADPAFIGLNMPSTGYVFHYSTNTFEIRVVPEPRGDILFGVGLAFAIAYLRLRGEKRHCRDLSAGSCVG